MKNIKKIKLLGCLLFLGTQNLLAANVHLTKSDPIISLKNEMIEIRFAKSSTDVSLFEIINKSSGKTIEITNDDFLITLDGADDLTKTNFLIYDIKEETNGKTNKLNLLYRHITDSIELIISYSLGKDDFFARRQLELVTQNTLEIRQVDAWKLDRTGNCIYQEEEPPKYPHPVWGFGENKGFGLPVLFEDSFWGLEYPAGYNQYRHSTLSFTHFPGRSIEGSFSTKPIVFGVVQEEGVIRSFQRYLDSILALPKNEPALFINYNTWETLMPPTEANSIALIDLFRKRLLEPYGANFDTFTFDDGWDDKKSLWDIRKDRFPQGFGPIKKELESVDMDLGLWLSPSSGYDHGPWLVANGYPQNGTRGKYLCQSAPQYASDLNSKIEQLLTSNDLKFFKFDGNAMNCGAEDHPWHLTGNYAKETNVDALIELLANIKNLQPNAFIDLTTGIWLSPWWLQYADAVWGEVYDGPPAAIVPTPNSGYGKFTTRDILIHKRKKENPAFPIESLEHLGTFTPDYDTMHDEIMSILGRGSRLLTFYLDPNELLRTEKDWKFLAKAITWGRQNASVTGNIKLIDGDILNHEPYGYMRHHKNKGIISISNPFIAPKSISIAMKDLMGEASDNHYSEKDQFYAEVVYPYHEVLDFDLDYNKSIDIQLEGYETLIIEVKPFDEDMDIIAGGRYQYVENSNGTKDIEVFGKAGTKKEFILKSKGKKDKEVIIQFEGKKEDAKVREAQMVLKLVDGENIMEGSCKIEVPKGTDASMHILFEPIAPSGYVPNCKIKVNGKVVETKINRAPLVLPHMRVFDEVPISDWSFISFKIPAGNNNIEIMIDAEDGVSSQFKAKVGSWLWMEHALLKKNLNIKSAQISRFSGDLSEMLPLPTRIEKMREIVPVHANKELSSIKKPFPAPKNVINLSELIPSKAAMSKGKVRVDLNSEGTGLSVGGQEFDKGLGMHSYARVVYDIKGLGFKKFKSLIGADDTAGSGEMEFEVWIDGVKGFTSGPMKKGQPAKPLEIDVTKAHELELRVFGGSDGLDGDHANWCNPTLYK